MALKDVHNMFRQVLGNNRINIFLIIYNCQFFNIGIKGRKKWVLFLHWGRALWWWIVGADKDYVCSFPFSEENPKLGYTSTDLEFTFFFITLSDLFICIYVSNSYTLIPLFWLLHWLGNNKVHVIIRSPPNFMVVQKNYPKTEKNQSIFYFSNGSHAQNFWVSKVGEVFPNSYVNTASVWSSIIFRTS